MTDDRFDDLMRDAAATYRRPPEPPLDEMWTAIEREMREAGAGSGEREAGAGSGKRQLIPQRFFPLSSSRIPLIAATLLIGIGIGRGSAAIGKHDTPPAATPLAVAGTTSPSTQSDTAFAEPYQLATTKYLGETAALLIALPSEVKAGRADEQFVSRAGELLTTTRLLLDSPAASDQSMRTLLEDLELVLAQVVHLQNDRGRAALDLINQALEQRDVLPRLRSAVADISAND